MTKILLLSDTHSYIDEQILKFVLQADEVWHAGDVGDSSVLTKIREIKPLRAVYGNIDDSSTRFQLKEDEFFEVEGSKIWLTHITGYPNRYEKRIVEKLRTSKVDILVGGHSHILKVIFDKKHDLLYLNPGACGKSGFHQIRTMLRFEIDQKLIKNMEIIELGNRI